MRSHVAFGALVYGLGCAPTRPGDAVSAFSAQQSTAPESPTATAPTASAAQGIAPPAISSAPPGECPIKWAPHDLGASVVRVPAAALALMMAPVIGALCACTQPGSHHSMIIDLEPSLGSVMARTNDDDLELDACLAARLGPNLYPPLEIGSDCIDCGPRRYGVFGGPPPPPPRGARIRMPLSIDRRGE